MAAPNRRAHLHLRSRGHRGGAILPHRSIFSLRLPLHRLAIGMLIASAFSVLLALAEPWIARLWSTELLWWVQALGLQGHFEPASGPTAGILTFPVPVVDLKVPEVGQLAPFGHLLAVVAIWWMAGWLPDSGKPAAYLLRFAVMIHGAATLYFLLFPASFPHSVINHVGGGLRQSWAMLLLTPWLHLCTYYLFPFAVWQRAALTAVTLAYLLLLAPLQYATHAALLSLSGLILMPLLHLLFGVMVPILGLVALYGWGMSWHDPARLTREH